MWGTLAAFEEQILDALAPRLAEQVVDVLAAGKVLERSTVERIDDLAVPQVVKGILEVVKITPGARGFLPGRLVEQMVEVLKVWSKDQILQSPREQTLDDLVPQICGVVDRCAQDHKQGPNLAEHQKSDSRDSWAADDKSVGGRAKNRFSRQNPAADGRSDR